MKLPIVPCNSKVQIFHNQLSITSQDSGISCGSTNMSKKSRMTVTDFEIIRKSMSPQRKKTLMCTEQSNFQILNKIKSTNSPLKKFNTIIPSEYGKFIISEQDIRIIPIESIKYTYPENVMTCRELSLIKTLQPDTFSEIQKSVYKEKSHQNRTSVCLIFWGLVFIN